MSRPFLIGFCGLLLAINAISCDITLPAFTAMGRDLGAPLERVQAVIAVFLLFSSFGQLVFGPTSDRFGRKPTILTGIAIYMAGALAGAMATSIELVLAGRALQGVGSACCIVVARAVLRDTHEGSDLARTMAIAMSIISFGPIFAPLLGFGLLTLGGWRGVFLGMAGLGIGLMAMGLLRLRETNAAIDPLALRPDRLASALTRVVRHPQSGYFLALCGINQFLMLSFVANAPRLYADSYGVDGLFFTLFFALNGIAIILGQVINARSIGSIGVIATTRSAAVALVLTVGTILGAALLGALPLWSFATLMFTFSAAFPAVMSNSASLVIEPHREIAGFASSAFGFVSQLVSAVLLLVTVPLIRGDMTLWAAGMLAAALLVLAALLAYRPAARQEAAP
jgi:DHA1 family bicyclomycin/chloramphenicol resistance-like MFS transporter